jgi:hypothetical protein
MRSNATTVAEYLAELPPDRRAAISAVRDVILKNLDKDYQETMGYGMIGYAVPHSVYPPGYHCDPKQPLPFAGLASQKGYMSVYLMSTTVPGGEGTWIRQQFAKAGKKLDMGKCCIRFKKLEDLPLDVIGEAIRRVPAKRFIAYYESWILPANKTAAARATKKSRGPAAASPRAVTKKKRTKTTGKTAAARPGRTKVKARTKTARR